VISFLLKNLTGYLQSHTVIHIDQSVLRDIRNTLYSQVTKLSLRYFTSERSGSIISRIINDTASISSGLVASFETIFKETLTLLLLLIYAFIISWKLTLFALLIFPFTAGVIAFVGRMIYNQSKLLQAKLADTISILQETILGIKVIKAFAMEDFENKKFQAETNNFFRTILKINRIKNLSSPVSEFFGVIAVGVMIWYGGREVLLAKSLSPAEFVGLLILVTQMMPPIKNLSNVSNRIQESLAAASRVFEIAEYEADPISTPSQKVVTEFNTALEYKDVSFKYEPTSKEFVLKNVNVKINKGEIVALVGPSGAGKTTFVDLVPRFYMPTSGDILLDGISTKDINLPSLRRLIGIVTQEVVLFNDTIKNNIAYGLAGFPHEQIVAAAKAANAHEFIIQLPNGYDTPIGERGLKLSGGQRQRLSIARALLKNPPIIIFDEATSALDSESELLVQEAMERLMKTRTSLVIAHRLSTIQNADNILVLRKGQLVEAGRHEDLLRQGGLYSKLYHMQFKLQESK